MSWITDLPTLFAYVVPGYLFLTIYEYMLFKDENNAERTSYVLLKSVVTSVVLTTAYDVFAHPLLDRAPDGTGGAYFGLLLMLSLFCGYLCARAIRTVSAMRFLHRIGIDRTASKNLWDDIIDENQWLRIWFPDSSLSYYGQIAFTENYSCEPLILLKNYQLLDGDDRVLEDHTANINRTVLLNLSGFKRVEIVDN